MGAVYAKSAHVAKLPKARIPILICNESASSLVKERLYGRAANATKMSPDGCALLLPVDLPEFLLSGLCLIGAPFFCGEKAHARAETFVVTRRLTGVLERGVDTGFVAARAHLSRQFRRDSSGAAASRAHGCCSC